MSAAVDRSEIAALEAKLWDANERVNEYIREVERREEIIAGLDHELKIATEHARDGWRAVAEFERNVLSAYRKSKKRSGHEPRQLRLKKERP